ncbi:hypothetical protein [Klebsiella pasteurii]|uniref:hypothetical protein n=1 Tax=Klebsiella pasteurii TaxID=2587529 RepID=UPI00292AD989|nr:hypothetical protein [Klebsiella pasteurii]MDV1909423.1 hypothetical protein [Klebsiella pasteurii]MDV1915145.1 hypothetical protein [Klebsiella pasteurii]
MSGNIGANPEGTKIELSSYDIASLMYHADGNNLRHSQYYELAVLVETHRWLNYLAQNPNAAMLLYVPNGTRKIIDKNETFAELLKLTGMVNSIVTEVLREITGQPTEYYTPAKGILLIKQAVY